MKLYEEALSCAQEAEEELWKIFFCWGKMDQGKGFHPGLRVMEGALLFFQSLPGKTRRYLAASSGTVFFWLWLGANDLPGIRWSEWQGGSEFSIFFELRMVRSFEWILFIHFFLSKRLIHRNFNFNHHLSTVFFQKTKILRWSRCLEEFVIHLYGQQLR